MKRKDIVYRLRKLGRTLSQMDDFKGKELISLDCDTYISVWGGEIHAYIVDEYISVESDGTLHIRSEGIESFLSDLEYKVQCYDNSTQKNSQ